MPRRPINQGGKVLNETSASSEQSSDASLQRPERTSRRETTSQSSQSSLRRRDSATTPPPRQPATNVRTVNTRSSSNRSPQRSPNRSHRRPERPSNPQQGPSRNPPQGPPRNPPGRAPGRTRKSSYPTKILREIRKYQKSTDLLIPRAPFSRAVREVLHQHGGDIRITPEAFNCIQEASELYLTHLIEDAYRCTIFRRAVTLHPRDLELVQYIRNGVFQ